MPPLAARPDGSPLRGSCHRYKAAREQIRERRLLKGSRGNLLAAKSFSCEGRKQGALDAPESRQMI
jgi:hypothetical protein